MNNQNSENFSINNNTCYWEKCKLTKIRNWYITVFDDLKSEERFPTIFKYYIINN